MAIASSHLSSPLQAEFGPDVMRPSLNGADQPQAP